jgi:NADH-quinone oxidoreductase subunit E
MNEAANNPSPPRPAASNGSLDKAFRSEIESYFARYPTRQAAVLPALHLIHERFGCVSPQAVMELAELLGLTPADVQDTISFYGFFKQEQPQGRYRVWVCRSISCAACDGETLLDYLRNRLGIQPGETTSDGLITLEAAECLGACDQAPAMLVNGVLYGSMTTERLDELLKAWKETPPL